MGFRNQNTGYPNNLLDSRAIVKKGLYALLPADGLVRNVLPGFAGADVTILSSPKLGASFVDYLVTLPAGGRNALGFGGDGVESFLCLLSGTLHVRAGEEDRPLAPHDYVYCPPDQKLYWHTDGAAAFFLYKRRYQPAGDTRPATVYGSALVPGTPYEDMEDVLIWNLLPTDMAYDMNFHILSFQPGASHGYVETHVQEHGALVLEGEGMYRLDDIWVPVKKGDYLFMGAYCPQAAYAIGRQTPFRYLYSKDCNRDEDI